MSNFVSVSLLAENFNPFEYSPWGCSVTTDMVEACLDAGDMDPDNYHSWSSRKAENPLAHARRIAYLVHYPSSDPIQIDVGSCGLNSCSHWPIEDGNHRLAAAIFVGAGYIEAEISGEIKYVCEILGVEI